MPWITPKLNWTDQDYYNFADLNRVENNTQVVAQELTAYSGNTITVTVITNRDMYRIEFYDSLNRIEGNIKLLADNFFEPNGWEPPKLNWKSGDRFDWRDAQRLERNLYLIYDLIYRAIESLKYCGTFNAGEDGDIY